MTDLPNWFGNTRKRQNQRSKKQERNRAKETGGRVQAGSGSSWRAPQDNRTPERLEQIKFTDKSSFTINVKEWLALEADALRDGRDPVFVIDFDKYGVRLEVFGGNHPGRTVR